MARNTASAFAGSLLGALLLLGCGPNKEERGLVTEPEVTTPMDHQDLSETEAERQRRDVEGIQNPSPSDDAPPQ